jgi:hypothetical protein
MPSELDLNQILHQNHLDSHMKYAFLNLGTVSTHFLPDKNSHNCHPHCKLRVRTDVYVPVGRLLTINN